MADLNSTIVRGNLRVTEDINTNGNITLSNVKNTKVLGTDANGLIETHSLGISDISNLQSTLNGKVNADDLLKISGSSSFGDTNWHCRKIGQFIFKSSDS